MANTNTYAKRRARVKQAPSTGKVQIIPIGGIGEIGKNMYAIRYENEILVIDSGLAFPGDEMLGIDVVIPDITYLVENKDKIKGIVLTHGHEDHIGGLPYTLPQLDVPVYGTKLTLGLVERKLREHHILGDCTLNVVRPEDKLQLGVFKVEFFRTNHSIPDSVGIAVKTPVGTIVHTGDFKFDQTPVNDKPTDYHRLSKLGEKGVLAMSDSTNAERPGYTLSEKEVGASIMEIFRTAKQRIILATFASNIHRIQQVIDAACHYNRKVAVVGRSMVNVVQVAQELGYLKVCNGTLVEVDELRSMPPNKAVIITTGSQGEPMSALTRIAKAEHRKVEIIPGDTVVIAATPIPGNEKLVSRTIDNLFARGANVIYERVSGVHVSGHASQEELKLMLNMLRPKYLIPVHGEHRHLIHHAKVAEKVGIKPDNVFIAENGQILEFTQKSGRVAGSVTSGRILVDGLGVGDVGSIVLRDRKLLSEDGILIVALTVNKETSQVVSGPEIYSRGFVYVRESETLMEEAREHVTKTLNKAVNGKKTDWSVVKNQVKDSLSRFVWEKMHRRPMILPVVMEI
ncbi:ribonuclease J [Dethiobacter alkaliphilus]|uniref:Ribonuclease J n=1 Tax=Dethiobacter alkaliphilus AHT 1 TaxID=555088 RepID=C0GIY2_DETAL|nr:beta-lactamase domain protein [Dethiobacter alkaliphilus AHT 1]